MDGGGRTSRRPKKRLRDRRLLLGVLTVLLVALVAVAGVTGWYGKAVVDGLNSMKRDTSLNPDYSGATGEDARPAPIPVAEGEKYAPVNIVLMGSDRRTKAERGRSDVLMVLHIPGDRKHAYLMSLPRDYWVSIPGRGTAKINAAYSWGGPSLAVRTVEQLLDVPIDHTALIDFDGFMNVIDAVGGVSVYNRYASSSDGYDFPQGLVELDGEGALAFVRERYDLPNGDFDRAERQRDVIQAVLAKLMSRGVLTNPTMFRDAVTTLGPNFTVDSELTNDALFDLATQMRINGGEDIKSFMAPTAGFGTSSDGQSYVKVDESKLAALATAIRNDAVDEYVAGS